MNQGKFDGGMLTEDEKNLHEYYRSLLNFTIHSLALMGEYMEIHTYNRMHTEWYNDRVFSFVRWQDKERLIIVSNFDGENSYGFDLQIPGELIEEWNIKKGTIGIKDVLTGEILILTVKDDRAIVRIDLEPLKSLIMAVPCMEYADG
jgi:hypothetical protein